MPTTVIPIHHRILARRLDPSKKTTGGIIIPDTSQGKHAEAEVVATGPGKPTDDGKWVPTGVEPGDRIVFENGKDMMIDGVMYVFLTPLDIFGIVRRTPKPEAPSDPKAP